MKPTFISEFNSWLNDVIVVQKTTRNSSGERVVASTQTFTNGRVRYVDKVIRIMTGEEKRINHIVYLPLDPGISLDDFLVFPDGGRREIVEVKREKDEDGSIDHVELALAR